MKKYTMPNDYRVGGQSLPPKTNKTLEQLRKEAYPHLYKESK